MTFAFIAVLACCVGSAKAGLINGSFESPVTQNGVSAANSYTGTQISGWTVDPGSKGADVGIYTTTTTIIGFSFNAEDQNQWVDLTGTQDLGGGGGIEQTISLTSGQYELSFYHGLSGLNGERTTTVDVYVNGNLLLSDTNADASVGSSIEWKHVTSVFTAVDGNNIIKFVNADSSSVPVNGLDNVSITSVSSVPEPSTLALFGLGTLGCAIGNYRRRRMATAAA